MAGDKGDHMRSKSTKLVILLAAAMILASCAGSISDQGEDQSRPGATETESEPEPVLPSDSPEKATPDRSEHRPIATVPPGLETVEMPPGIAETGEVPVEIMDEIIRDLPEMD